jgi:hypothetical protein
VLAQFRVGSCGYGAPMRKSLALVALAIAGFTFGLAGCGEEDNGSPGGEATTTVETGMTDDDTTTNGTTTDEDDGPDY